MILGIDHIGLAVRGVPEAAMTFERILARPGRPVEELTEQAVRVCFVPASWGPTVAPAATEPSLVARPRPPLPGLPAWPARLELLMPTADDTPIGRFLTRRGEGLHHVCFAVDDIHAELARLTGEGFEAIDHTPRRGHGGLVVFLHPKSAHGVLIELLQRDPTPPAPVPAPTPASTTDDTADRR